MWCMPWLLRLFIHSRYVPDLRLTSRLLDGSIYGVSARNLSVCSPVIEAIYFQRFCAASVCRWVQTFRDKLSTQYLYFHTVQFYSLLFIIRTNSGAVGWRHCATSRKDAGSIHNGVIGIFHWHNPSGRTMALGADSVSNRNEYQEYFLGGKGGRYVGLTNLPPSCADCLEIWEPQPPGNLRACPGL